MPEEKRTPLELPKAEHPEADIESIDVQLDFGSSMTLEAFCAAIDGLRVQQQQYNMLLTSIDYIHNEMREAQKTLSEQSDRMLHTIAGMCTHNSSEYEMAGRS